MATQAQAADSGPSLGAKLGALAFWLIAAGLILILAPIENQPPMIWVLRGLALFIWLMMGLQLIFREKQRAAAGLDLDRDATPFDYWTIAHTWAGVVFGIFGIPWWLVAVLTIAWEIFEWAVPGFGETETFANRVVDIAVAWVAWILVAGGVALVSQTDMPWFIPSIDSLVR
ncbi:MAG: hypothetical protein U0670_18925 [Anaerolineae bacterium]